MQIQLTINGKLYHIETHPMRRLLDILREDLALTGSKEGCGEGECGACSVIVDGELVNACLIPAIQVTGCNVQTIEGLGTKEQLSILQDAFLQEGAVHCGFCTPGMIMAAHALLAQNTSPTRLEIQQALSGNICRCTGYEKICKAVELAVKRGYPALIDTPKNLCDEPAILSTEEKTAFFIPQNLDEAVSFLAQNPNLTLLAGVTDLGPDMKSGKVEIPRAIDLFRLKELKGICVDGATIRIGACSSNADIIASDVAQKHLPALVYAAARSGAPAIQNRATIGGNIVTASGAGDLPVVLHALNARVLLVSNRGTRELPLEEFVLGYRKCVLAEGELLKEILIPLPEEGSIQRFYKRGSRNALTLSRVSIAFYLLCKEGRVESFRAAAGSMSPTPQRLHAMETGLTGQPVNADLSKKAARLAEDTVNPRKSPAYRKSITYNLTKRFFDEFTA